MFVGAGGRGGAEEAGRKEGECERRLATRCFRRFYLTSGGERRCEGANEWESFFADEAPRCLWSRSIWERANLASLKHARKREESACEERAGEERIVSESAEPPGEKKKLARSLARSPLTLLVPSCSLRLPPLPSLSPLLSLSLLSFSRDGLPPEEDQARGRPRRRPRDRPRRLDCRGKRKSLVSIFFWGGETA